MCVFQLRFPGHRGSVAVSLTFPSHLTPPALTFNVTLCLPGCFGKWHCEASQASVSVYQVLMRRQAHPALDVAANSPHRAQALRGRGRWALN